MLRTMVDVYVGVGSNIDPERHLHQAVAELEQRFGVVHASAVYRSPAAGFPGPDFLNLVITFRSDAGPAAVKKILAAIEDSAGRSHSDANAASCSLDLDLLMYGCRVDAQARLPRDDILRRVFVLAPLAELAPGLTHPVTGQTILAAWQAMTATRPLLKRVGTLRELVGPANA